MRPPWKIDGFFWDVVRRNPGRITVLVLILSNEVQKRWDKNEAARAPPVKKDESDSQ